MTVLSAVTEALRAHVFNRPPEQHTFALIDMAALSHLDQSRAILQKIRHAGAVSVLDDERPEALLATPWLLPLDGEAQLKWVDRSCEWALRGPALTWISSPLSTPELARRLRHRTEAELPGRHAILLRHYDPRVLPELIQVLSPPQRLAFTELGHAWLYLDRLLRLRSITVAAPQEMDRQTTPLVLDEQQFAALLNASEIDQLMPELTRSAPIEFMGLTVDRRVQLARECLSLADAWHLEGLADKATVGLLLLKLGEGFHAQPAWAPWIERLMSRQVGLLEAIDGATQGRTA